jgi:predicted amidohydrolase
VDLIEFPIRLHRKLLPHETDIRTIVMVVCASVRTRSQLTIVAAVQFQLGKQSYREAIESAQRLVKAAAERRAEIVCFPEHWLLEYREQGHLAIEQLCKVANDARISVVTGANYTPKLTPASPELRVRSLVIGPDGRRLGQQDKVHLYQSEKKVATPGSLYDVFQLALGRIGIMICYDAMFPEAARTLALKGADLIFVPSRIGYAALNPWILYLRTRAMENRIPIIAPNVFRPPRYVGGTVIVDVISQAEGRAVTPKIVAFAGSGEGVAVADVDIERARELRRERFLDRHPIAYFGH